MKTFYILLFLSLNSIASFAQEKTKKQLKEEQKAIKQKEIALLVESKEFKFEANMAFPQGYRSINLTTNPNFFIFKKDSVISEMPFFGRAYSGVGYSSGDGGHSFKGKYQKYSEVKDKKSYIIKCDVKGENDSYSIILTVFLEGNASLVINSNKRSTISYRGEIYKLQPK